MESQTINEAYHVINKYISKINPHKKAALLLNALPAELIVEVSRNLTEREIRSILPLLSSLPYSWDIETIAVVDEFMQINSLWKGSEHEPTLPEEVLTAFIDRAQGNPKEISRFLKNAWLHNKATSS